MRKLRPRKASDPLLRGTRTLSVLIGVPALWTCLELARVEWLPRTVPYLLLGTAILLGTTTPFIAPAPFAIVADRWYIAFEERAMQAKFGPEYAAYMGRTRRWL